MFFNLIQIFDRYRIQRLIYYFKAAKIKAAKNLSTVSYD